MTLHLLTHRARLGKELPLQELDYREQIEVEVEVEGNEKLTLKRAM